MMGIRRIKMPDIGEGIAEVELVAWHVKPGDGWSRTRSLADVMTDKATSRSRRRWPAGARARRRGRPDARGRRRS